MEYRNFIRLVGAMILLSVVLTAFHGSQQRIESTIDDAFKYAVDKDYQNRQLYLIRNQAIRYGVRDYALSPSSVFLLNICWKRFIGLIRIR